MGAQNLFANSRVNITAEVKRHLGAVTRNTEHLVKGQDNQLTTLSTIAETQKQAAHTAFASRFKSKLNYSLRTIPNIRQLLLATSRKTIRNKFIPAVTGRQICNDKERLLISLPTRYGGLAIPIFHETPEITSEPTSLIIQQTLQYDIIEDNLKKHPKWR